MTRMTCLIVLAALAAPAAAQPVAPAPAPAAQQTAPPGRIGRPLDRRQTPAAKIRRDETTGAAVHELAPGRGDAATSLRRGTEPPSR